MKTKHWWTAAALCLAAQGFALAQGRPAAEGSAEHRHHAEGAAPAEGPQNAARGQAREWTALPLILPVMRGERERGALSFALKNSEAPALDVFAPDATAPQAQRTVAVDGEGAKVTMLPKLGNYYWLSAREEKEGQVRVASTVAYFSEPGPAPTRLLASPKNDIEIVPQPLPREHGNYRESEKWAFALRFKGQPLANATLKMETEFGTHTSFVSDGNGIATVLFPRDFRPAEKGRDGGHHGGPRRAKFVLSVETAQDGTRYLAAFNATYSPDPERNRSLAWGAAFGLLGIAAATPLLRRRPEKNGQGEANA